MNGSLAAPILKLDTRWLLRFLWTSELDVLLQTKNFTAPVGCLPTNLVP